MRISPIDHNRVILDFPGVGSIHVSRTDDGTVELLYYDHCKITIRGSHKREPLVTVASDEYVTHLRVCEPESKWATLVIDSQEGGESNGREVSERGR